MARMEMGHVQELLQNSKDAKEPDEKGTVKKHLLPVF